MTVFYENLTETKARIWLIYFITVPTDMESLSHFEVETIPQSVEEQTLYCNPQTQELWYE
jgi:hypothetical protein